MSRFSTSQTHPSKTRCFRSIFNAFAPDVRHVESCRNPGLSGFPLSHVNSAHSG